MIRRCQGCSKWKLHTKIMFEGDEKMVICLFCLGEGKKYKRALKAQAAARRAAADAMLKATK